MDCLLKKQIYSDLNDDKKDFINREGVKHLLAHKLLAEL